MDHRWCPNPTITRQEQSLPCERATCFIAVFVPHLDLSFIREKSTMSSDDSDLGRELYTATVRQEVDVILELLARGAPLLTWRDSDGCADAADAALSTRY